MDALAYAPNDTGSLPLHSDLSFPFTITWLSACNAHANLATRAIATHKVLGTDGEALVIVDIFQDDLNRVSLGEFVVGCVQSPTRNKAVRAEYTPMRSWYDLFGL